MKKGKNKTKNNNKNQVLVHREKGSLIVVDLDSWCAKRQDEYPFKQNYLERLDSQKMDSTLAMYWSRSVRFEEAQVASCVLPLSIADDSWERKGIWLT